MVFAELRSLRSEITDQIEAVRVACINRVAKCEDDIAELKEKCDETTALVRQAVDVATAAGEKVDQSDSAQLLATLKAIEAQLEDVVEMTLEHRVTINKSFSDSFVINSFPTAADKTQEQLQDYVATKFQETGLNLLPAASIKSVIRLNQSMVKVVCTSPAAQQKVVNAKSALRRLQDAANRITVNANLTRAEQQACKDLKPVLDYLTKTMVANEKNPWFDVGVLKYWVCLPGGKWVPKIHRANRNPKLVELAKEQLAVIAEKEAAGEPVPARIPELAAA